MLLDTVCSIQQVIGSMQHLGQCTRQTLLPHYQFILPFCLLLRTFYDFKTPEYQFIGVLLSPCISSWHYHKGTIVGEVVSIINNTYLKMAAEVYALPITRKVNYGPAIYVTGFDKSRLGCTQ